MKEKDIPNCREGNLKIPIFPKKIWQFRVNKEKEYLKTHDPVCSEGTSTLKTSYCNIDFFNNDNIIGVNP